jgi:hypothetical protein
MVLSSKRYKLTITLPQVIIDLVWSFSDIDTKLKNGIKPQKLTVNFDWKPPRVSFFSNFTYQKIYNNYTISYLYKTRETIFRYGNFSNYYNENMKHVKLYGNLI